MRTSNPQQRKSVNQAQRIRRTPREKFVSAGRRNQQPGRLRSPDESLCTSPTLNHAQAKKSHKGQLAYLDEKGKVRVRPIYVFESTRAVLDEIQQQGDAINVIGFFQSGCTVELRAPAGHTTNTLPPGRYILNTLKADGSATLTSSTSKIFKDIPMIKLLAAGFRRPK